MRTDPIVVAYNMPLSHPASPASERHCSVAEPQDFSCLLKEQDTKATAAGGEVFMSALAVEQGCMTPVAAVVRRHEPHSSESMEETNKRNSERHNSSEQGSDTPLFLTFATVPEDVTEALLLAASDLAVVVEADGRYDDVFAPPLTPRQLQQQQLLEDHLRELVRDALQVETLLNIFASITACSPGKNIIPAALTPELSFRPPVDPIRRAAAAAAIQHSTAETKEHLGGDSSKSSSQTATRCTSAAAGKPPGAAAHAGARGGAAAAAEGRRPAPGGASSPARLAADMTGEAAQSHETKGTSSSGTRKMPCTFPPGNSSPSGGGISASSATANATSTSASGPGGTFSAALISPSPEVSNIIEHESSSRRREQKKDIVIPNHAQHSPTGEEEEEAATAVAGRRGDVQNPMTDEDKEKHIEIFRQEAMQKECLCDCFVNIVRFCHREHCTSAETSTLLGIMKEVFLRAVLENQTALESFKYFKRLLLKYSVQRPPLSIRIFTPAILKRATRFMMNSFYRHYELYAQCFIPEVHAVIVQQPIPVTTIGRLKLASCSPVVAASPRLVAVAAARQQRYLDVGATGRDTAAGDLLTISSNESSQSLDAFFSFLPEEGDEANFNR